MDGRNYCSRTWGIRLRRRLNRIENWAEKQGLELAADCHLVRILQASHLLQVSFRVIGFYSREIFKRNHVALKGSDGRQKNVVINKITFLPYLEMTFLEIVLFSFHFATFTFDDIYSL